MENAFKLVAVICDISEELCRSRDLNMLTTGLYHVTQSVMFLSIR